MKTAKRLMVATILVIPTPYSNAALVAYTDQAAFLSDLAALGSVGDCRASLILVSYIDHHPTPIVY